MALYRHYTNSDTNVYVWHITETIEELVILGALTENELEIFNNFTSSNRKKEWCATRALLRSIFSDAEIEYTQNRAPRLKNSDKSISISHTLNYASIAISDFKCGVDIELIARNFNKVAHKYVNEHEEYLINSLTIDRATALAIIWSYKESLFKLAEIGNVDFKEDIKIESISKGMISSLFKERRVTGNYIIEDNYVITFCQKTYK